MTCSRRIHGYHATRIDPLDLLHSEGTGVLDPERYGPVASSNSYDVNGIL